MNRQWATRFASKTPHSVAHLLTHGFWGLPTVQVHFAVVLSLSDNPQALVGSSLGPAASCVAFLISEDTLRIDAEGREDHGKPGRIEDSIHSSNPCAAGSVIGLRHTACRSYPLQFVLPLNHSSSPKRGRRGWTRSILSASRGRTEARISPSMHGHLYSAEFRCADRLPASSSIHVTMASSLSKSLGTHNSGYLMAKIDWSRSGLQRSRFGRRVESCIFPTLPRCFPSFGCL